MLREGKGVHLVAAEECNLVQLEITEFDMTEDRFCRNEYLTVYSDWPETNHERCVHS